MSKKLNNTVSGLFQPCGRMKISPSSLLSEKKRKILTARRHTLVLKRPWGCTTELGWKWQTNEWSGEERIG